MNRILLSDLHVVNPELSDARYHAACELIAAGEADEYVINGDALDFWLFPQNPERVRLAGRGLLLACRIAAAKGKRVIFIEGNHDPRAEMAVFLAGEFPLVEQLSFTDGGKRFIVQHGHQFDPANHGNASVFGRLATAANGLLSVFGVNGAQWSFAKNADDQLVAEQRHRIRSVMSGRCDVYVCGHTHHQTLATFYDTHELTLLDCGDILTHGTYARIVDGVPQLCKLGGLNATYGTCTAIPEANRS